MSELKVPPGWTLETLDSGGSLLFSPEPERYMATIDWAGRGIRTGLSRHGKFISRAEYGGRGWRQRLLDDAVRHLSSI